MKIDENIGMINLQLPDKPSSNIGMDETVGNHPEVGANGEVGGLGVFATLFEVSV